MPLNNVTDFLVMVTRCLFCKRLDNAVKIKNAKWGPIADALSFNTLSSMDRDDFNFPLCSMGYAAQALQTRRLKTPHYFLYDSALGQAQAIKVDGSTLHYRVENSSVWQTLDFQHIQAHRLEASVSMLLPGIQLAKLSKNMAKRYTSWFYAYCIPALQSQPYPVFIHANSLPIIETEGMKYKGLYFEYLGNENPFASYFESLKSHMLDSSSGNTIACGNFTFEQLDLLLNLDGLFILSNTPLEDAMCARAYNAQDQWLDLTQTQYRLDTRPLCSSCTCSVCKDLSRSYFHHLYQQCPMLAQRFIAYHNVFWLEKTNRIAKLTQTG